MLEPWQEQARGNTKLRSCTEQMPARLQAKEGQTVIKSDCENTIKKTTKVKRETVTGPEQP